MLTVDVLLGASEVNGLDATRLLLGRAGHGGRASLGKGGSHGTGGSDKGASLDGRGGDLAGQWRAEGLGEAAGGHGES